MHSADASDRALVDTSARVGLREPLLVFALASLTNFLWLGRKSVWLDEAVSVEHTLGGFRNVLYIIRWQDPNSGLYYLLLTAWTRVFGAGEWAIRAPSAVLAAATAALVYLIGLHLSGRATARLAALLIALNAYVITFGQTARGYALVLFLVTLATWCLVRSAEHPSRPLAALYVASAVLSFHAHYFGALVVAAHGLALLISGRLRRVHVYCAIVIAIGCLPMLYIAATHGRAEVAWIQVPTPRTLLLALTNLAGISLAALGLLSALALRSVTSSRDTSGRWRTNLLLTWLLLPLLSVYMLSQRVPLFHSRYFLICAPALVLLAVSGVAQLRSGRVRAAAIAALAIATIWPLPEYYRDRGYEAWREAAAYVKSSPAASAAVLYSPRYARPPFAYYERRYASPALTNLARKPLSGQPAIWLVERLENSTTQRLEGDSLRAVLGREYQLQESREFTQVRASLYVRR